MRLRTLTVVFICALAAGASSASGAAWAAKPKLWFSTAGEHMADGSPVSIGLETDFYCSIADEGTLVSNGKSRDEMIFTSGGGICYGQNHHEVTGHLKKVVWRSDGTFTATADIVYRQFSESRFEKGCSYKVTKLTGIFPIGELVYAIEYKGTATLEKRRSEAGCPESEPEDDESNLPYETMTET